MKEFFIEYWQMMLFYGTGLVLLFIWGLILGLRVLARPNSWDDANQVPNDDNQNTALSVTTFLYVIALLWHVVSRIIMNLSTDLSDVGGGY